ncbi:MAG: GNAT family N-acetyltransferase [Chloroflexi bacterium]|nr:GNAT family N-acetyltransferase [Chloroflexota bacterium]
MNKIHIRPAEDEDLPALAELWAALDRFHRSLGLAFPEVTDAPGQWLASFQRTLGRFSFVWLAETDNGPRAFLLARLKLSPAYLGGVQAGEISDLYVDDELRGQGAGRQLVDAAMQKFAELGVHSVEVQVQAGNDQGLDFWRKQGFALDLTLVRKVLEG